MADARDTLVRNSQLGLNPLLCPVQGGRPEFAGSHTETGAPLGLGVESRGLTCSSGSVRGHSHSSLSRYRELGWEMFPSWWSIQNKLPHTGRESVSHWRGALFWTILRCERAPHTVQLPETEKQIFIAKDGASQDMNGVPSFLWLNVPPLRKPGFPRPPLLSGYLQGGVKVGSQLFVWKKLIQ